MVERFARPPTRRRWPLHARGAAILREPRLRLEGGLALRWKGHQAIDAGLGEGSDAVDPLLAGDHEVLVARVDGEAQRGWIATLGFTAGADLHHPRGHLGRAEEDVVQLVSEADGQARRPSRTVAAHDDGDVLLDAPGLVDGITHVHELALVGGVTGRQHPADDLEMLLEEVEAFLDGREAVAVGEPLILLPAGADADLRSVQR